MSDLFLDPGGGLSRENSKFSTRHQSLDFGEDMTPGLDPKNSQRRTGDGTSGY